MPIMYYYYIHHHHHHHHPLSLLHSSLVGSQNSKGLTDQTLFIHCSGKKFLIIRHTVSVTDLYIRIYIYIYTLE